VSNFLLLQESVHLDHLFDEGSYCFQGKEMIL
jgi:hypothetical protein